MTYQNAIDCYGKNELDNIVVFEQEQYKEYLLKHQGENFINVARAIRFAIDYYEKDNYEKNKLKVSQFAELYKYGKTRKSGHLAFKYKRKIYSTVSNNKNYRNLSPKCPTRMAFRALYSTENWESYNKFDTFIENVNKLFKKEIEDKTNKYRKMTRKKYDFEVIKKASTGEEIKLQVGEPYCLTERIGKNQYFVHKDADDYFFAGLLKMKNISCSKLWEKDSFKDWFIGEECRWYEEEKGYFPSVKWHLYEYILYQELNGQYRFSIYGKLLGDDYEKKFGGNFGESNGLKKFKCEMENLCVTPIS